MSDYINKEDREAINSFFSDATQQSEFTDASTGSPIPTRATQTPNVSLSISFGRGLDVDVKSPPKDIPMDALGNFATHGSSNHIVKTEKNGTYNRSEFSIQGQLGIKLEVANHDFTGGGASFPRGNSAPLSAAPKEEPKSIFPTVRVANGEIPSRYEY